jgi:fumarate reductase flavoprotein subunit
MGLSMEEGCGIYRTPELMQKTVDKLAELQERFKRVRITDTSSVFNTDLLYTIELGHGLNVAECMAHSALARKESRGAHQRLDEGCTERDDVNFLKHTLAFRDADGTPSGVQRCENHHSAAGKTRVRCGSGSSREEGDDEWLR